MNDYKFYMDTRSRFENVIYLSPRSDVSFYNFQILFYELIKMLMILLKYVLKTYTEV